MTHDYRSVRARTQSLSVLNESWPHLDTYSSRTETVELAFHSKALRSICESDTKAVDTFGVTVASLLRHRLADLCAAKSPYDLPIGKPRALETDPTRMMINLCDGYSLTFCANHPKNPQTESGLIDWQKVNRIKVLDIVHENNH